MQSIIGLAIIATFVVYYFQLIAMKHGAKCQNTLSIIDFIRDPQVRKAREYVIQKLNTKPYNVWTIDEKDTASIVCGNYDLLSILILKRGFVENEIFIDNWGPSIKRCYRILKPHIEEMQKHNGPRYWNDFKQLFDKCEEYDNS